MSGHRASADRKFNAKIFVKNLNLNWVFEVCRKIDRSWARNNVGLIVDHLEIWPKEAYFNIGSSSKPLKASSREVLSLTNWNG